MIASILTELIFNLSTLIQTVHENRIYSLKIICGPSYPDIRPDVQFISRVNLPFVNQMNGIVDYNKLPVLSAWTRQSSIETVLVEIRKSVIHHTIFIHFELDIFIVEKWQHSIIANCPNPPKVLPSRVADSAKIN